jgi:hypothetical protein
MKPLPPKVWIRRCLRGWLAGAAFAVPAASALAQAVCSSDGQMPPARLLERFTDAACESCWRDAHTALAARQTLALDWVLPAGDGDSAPLAAVALPESAARQQAPSPSSLAAGGPGQAARLSRLVRPRAAGGLRVAQGPALSGYLGASITYTPMKSAVARRWIAWLALVETLPPGIEGSPVERNLVRSAFQLDWAQAATARRGTSRFFEQRSMGIPPGADPARLRVVGWVERPDRQVAALAVAACRAGPRRDR